MTKINVLLKELGTHLLLLELLKVKFAIESLYSTCSLNKFEKENVCMKRVVMYLFTFRISFYDIDIDCVCKSNSTYSIQIRRILTRF